MEVLSWEEAGFLQARLASRPVIAVEAPEPEAAAPVALFRDVSAGSVPVRPWVDDAAPRAVPVASAPARGRRFGGGTMLRLAVASGMTASLALGVGISRYGWSTLSPGSPVPADSAGAGGATRPVAQAAPPAPRVLSSASTSHPASGASPSPTHVLASPAATSAPDRTAMAGPVAPQPAARDAPARPASQEAGTTAGRSANPDRIVPAPGAASPAGPEHTAAGPALQQPAAQGTSAALAASAEGALAAAAIPGQPASLARAALSALDGAGAIFPTPPRPRRRAASRQEDTPAREAQRDIDPQQDAPRRDVAATPRSPARTVSLHARAPEERDDLPLPPPPSRRWQRAVPRSIPLGSKLFEPEPPEPEASGPSYSGPSYIGTFGTDSNGVRTFRPGQ